MNHSMLMKQMETGAEAIRRLVEGVQPEQASWKINPAKWSLLEVMAHLHDEEREDFRVRLDILLHRPGDPWPPIDPQGWVAEREYAKKDLGEALQGFLKERADSLAWLRGLKAPAWDNYDEHPVAGKITAGDIFSSWVAHDFLHIRQLTELHYRYLQHRIGSYSTAYAGDW
jgi:hypothetical protein